MHTANPAFPSPPPAASPSRRKALTLCLAIGAFGAAGAARADSVNLGYLGTGHGRVIHASVGTQSWDLFAGRLIHSASNGTGQLRTLPSTIVTFCADLMQSRSSIVSSFIRTSVAGTSPNAGIQNLGVAKQQAIYDVYQAAAGRQFTAGHDYATAFQITMWEVIYDYNVTVPNHGLNVAAGNFRAASLGQGSLTASIATKVQFLLSSVGSGTTAQGLMGLKSGPYQDQIYLPPAVVGVPLPPAAWMTFGGLSLVGLAHCMRRRS
ncbi:MAG: hypothetical protein ACKVW3_03235 [Phycisphaerales bacterium]